MYNPDYFDPDLLRNIIETRLESVPDDLEHDCWLVPSFENAQNNAQKRPRGRYMGEQHLLYQITYMAWHGIPVWEKPFTDTFVASHNCEKTSPDSYRCVNPLHIHGEPQSDNIRRYAESAEGQLWKDKLRKVNKERAEEENGVLPRGLSDLEKMEWYLKYRTLERTDLPKTNDSYCLQWKNNTCTEQYPRIGFNTKERGGHVGKLMAHRLIHAILNDIPYGTEESPWKVCKKTGDVAHHECNNKWCVNPEHIDRISRSENTKAWAETRKTG